MQRSLPFPVGGLGVLKVPQRRALEGVQRSEPTESPENPGVSNSKNGLYWEWRTITFVIAWKILHGEKKT